jgi:putative sigma-54 modulation protein
MVAFDQGGSDHGAIRVTIRGSRGVDRALREVTRDRLTAALGRFGSRIRSLRVRFLDVNGPRGGDDQRCIVEVHLRVPRRTALIEDTDRSAAAAISRAAERAGRAVARIVDIHHDRRPPSAAFSR